jgi:4-nitrophenyl phosphatase
MNDWLSAIRGLVLDMDGVLWRGDHSLLDMPAFFEQIGRLNLQIILATNNATRSVVQYQEKLQGFGVELRPDQIVNSPMAAAFYLRRKYPLRGSVYIVGESGLHDTLAAEGFINADEGVLAVVAGLDRTITYPKLSRASMLIRSGAEFIGTNPDLTYPTPKGLAPGAGAVLAFIEAASGVRPVIAGKPEAFMFDLAIQRMGLRPGQVLAIGDRLDTDILGGQRAGCRCCGVLSGVSTRTEIDAWTPPLDLVIDNLADLIPLLQNRG